MEMSRQGRTAAALALAALLWSVAVHAAAGLTLQAYPARTSWDGVYSESQAQRGRKVFVDECSACHAYDLTGGAYFNAPPLVGSFLERWDGLTLAELFLGKISTSMPQWNPGSLPIEQYRDVLAFILQANKFPAGSTDLPEDPIALAQITIVSKPASKK